MPPTPNGRLATERPVPTWASPQASIAPSVVVPAICDGSQVGAASELNLTFFLS